MLVKVERVGGRGIAGIGRLNAFSMIFQFYSSPEFFQLLTVIEDPLHDTDPVENLA